ncbi:MAG: S8 family peptidase [Bacteroidales bacterium]
MKNRISGAKLSVVRGVGILVVCLGLLVLGTSCKKDNQVANENNSSVSLPAGDYIVGLNPTKTKIATLKSSAGTTYKQSVQVMNSQLASFLQKQNIDPSNLKDVYCSAFVGFAAKLTADQAKALSNSAEVNFIQEDKPFQTKITKPTSILKATPASSYTPWGVAFVGGSHDGTGKRAWVIDTGIDPNHRDLNVDVANGRNFCSSYPAGSSSEDDNGHGTHVSGTIAAKGTFNGIVGVAAGAYVVPVKVVDAQGSGIPSDCIKGVDYVSYAAKPGDVVNMSLGFPLSTALDNAVKSAANKGIIFVLAAGNEQQDAKNSSPQRVINQNVIKVAAIDKNSKWAYFSNYGSCVDVAAPGVNIISTYKGGRYADLDGTSMACPHVVGLMLLEKQMNKKGNAYCPIDHKNYPIVTY